MEEALRGRSRTAATTRFDARRRSPRPSRRTCLDVSKDRHIGFAFNPEHGGRYQAPPGPERGGGEDRSASARLLESRRDNFGFRKVERLPGNIGYLDFRVFDSPDRAGADGRRGHELPGLLRRHHRRPPPERRRRSGPDPAHQLLLLRRARSTSTISTPGPRTRPRTTGPCPMSPARRRSTPTSTS